MAIRPRAGWDGLEDGDDPYSTNEMPRVRIQLSARPRTELAATPPTIMETLRPPPDRRTVEAVYNVGRKRPPEVIGVG